MNDLIRLALEVSVQSVALAFCVGAILAAARIRSGSVSHAAWVSVLCAMMLMPALSRVTPAVGLPVPLLLAANAPDSAFPDLFLVPMKRAATRPAPTPMNSTGVTRIAPTQASGALSWIAIISGAYCAGLFFMLSYMAAGWRSARRLSRSAEAVALSVPGARVCQSALVATPLTIGVLSPRILLPACWRDWTDTKLHAVLAHEAAHVRQRHALVSLAARLNRCIFWFHPLAWWLERKLAITAEHSCDEAGVRAIGQVREYAQVLLEMAEAVRQQGGRFSFSGVGIDGGRALEARIDRILRNDVTLVVSRTRRAIVAVGCAASIFAVAACRQHSAVAPSTEKERSPQSAAMAAAVSDLMKVRWNPQDPSAEKKLANIRATLEQSNDVTVLLSGAKNMVSMCPPAACGEVFAVGKAAIERALKLDPNSALARELMMVAAVRDLMSVRWNPQDPAAQKKLADIRATLEQSNDVSLLLTSATSMVSMGWPTNTGPAAGGEVFAVGKAAIERALKLDPKSAWAHQLMNKVHDQELVVSLPEKVWSGPLQSRHEAILALPDGERFRELSILAISAGDVAVRANVINHDSAAEKAAWEQAGRYAHEALDVAPRARAHPDFGTSLFRANMVAGMAALVEGDKKAAEEFAGKAIDAPATSELQYPIVNARPWAMNWNFPAILAKALLQQGEGAAVADLLERYARLNIADRDRWLADVAAIRQGKQPLFIQTRP